MEIDHKIIEELYFDKIKILTRNVIDNYRQKECFL